MKAKTVQFPSAHKNWKLLKIQLQELKSQCCVNNCTIEDISKLHTRIFGCIHESESSEHGSQQSRKHDVPVFSGLEKYINLTASSHEGRRFMKTTFPGIIDLALGHEQLIPPAGVAISVQQTGLSTVLSRRFVASILACAFLCLFPEKETERASNLHSINFTRFFHHLPAPSQCAKLRCILNYFDRVVASDDSVCGEIHYIRRVMAQTDLPTMDTWRRCDLDLCPLIVHNMGLITDAGSEAIEVDFANKSIGGGVLSRGRIQEEIRFSQCPELVASRLFLEEMQDNEAIVIRGYEQFSQTSGYAGSLQYEGDYADPATRAPDGSPQSTLCAIDAVPFAFGGKSRQYLDRFILRDLNKAAIGFASISDTQSRPMNDQYEQSVSSVTEDEFHTATESLEEEDGNSVIAGETKTHLHRHIPLDSSADQQNMQDKFGSQASNVSVVLTSAVSDSADNGKVSSVALVDGQNNYCGNEYLEPDYREWLSNFRRRSSNLSDITSRRSSCSTKYSSDFSSEFEDYYDAFQKKEQKLKPKPIVEKTAKSAVNSFATSLISNLLHDGTLTAALDHTTVQKFRAGKPVSTIQKPTPVKVCSKLSKQASFGSAVLDSTKPVQKAVLSEDVVRKYVDKLFETIPYGGDRPLSNGIHNENERTLATNLVSSNGDRSENDGMQSNHSRGVVSPGLSRFCEDLAGTILQEALSTFKFCTTKAHEYIRSSTNLTSCSSFDDISVTDLVQTVVIADRLVNQIFDEVRMEFFPSQFKESCLWNKNNNANGQGTAPDNARNADGDAGRGPELQPDSVPLPAAVTPRTGILRYAESLSRTVLTKAFMEVQLVQRRRPACRRSSSSSISSHTHTSRSDAYLAHFANELARRSSLDDMNLLRRRSSSGFRDITLSRFAEELMRSVPHSPYVDMFSNSRRNSVDSVCSQQSNRSGFRDPVLANFEEELLHSNVSRMSIRHRTKSQKHRKNHGKPRGSHSRPNTSGPPCNVCTCIVDLYGHIEDAIIDFADEVACDVLNKSFSSIFIDSCNNEVKFTPVRRDVRHQLERYAGSLAETILNDSLLLAHVVSSSEGTSSFSSDSSSARILEQKRVTFHDALDMPYGKLNFWSDVMARQILNTAYNELHNGNGSQVKRSDCRSIATGNWGCGAFGGNPQLKVLIQWMAASYVGAPRILYYTFGHDQLKKLEEVVQVVKARQWRVKDLMEFTQRICISAFEQFDQDDKITMDLFDELLSLDNGTSLETHVVKNS